MLIDHDLSKAFDTVHHKILLDIHVALLIGSLVITRAH